MEEGEHKQTESPTVLIPVECLWLFNNNIKRFSILLAEFGPSPFSCSIGCYVCTFHMMVLAGLYSGQAVLHFLLCNATEPFLCCCSHPYSRYWEEGK